MGLPYGRTQPRGAEPEVRAGPAKLEGRVLDRQLPKQIPRILLGSGTNHQPDEITGCPQTNGSNWPLTISRVCSSAAVRLRGTVKGECTSHQHRIGEKLSLGVNADPPSEVLRLV